MVSQVPEMNMRVVLSISDLQNLAIDDPRRQLIQKYVNARKQLLALPSKSGNLAQDLQARSKQVTVENLSKQSEQYRRFNEDVMYLVQPEQMREAVKQKIRIRAAPEKQLLSEIDKVNQGLQFQNQVQRMQSYQYYKEKYDLDAQVAQKCASISLQNNESVIKKRDKKAMIKKIKNYL